MYVPIHPLLINVGPFVSVYKRLVGGNKRESRQTLCLFPPILAYVVSRFRDLNYEKRENLRLDYNPSMARRSGNKQGQYWLVQSLHQAREDIFSAEKHGRRENSTHLWGKL